MFRLIPAEITRFDDSRAGNLDFTDIPTGHCRAARADPALKHRVAVWPAPGAYAIRFDMEKPPFDDRRVRLAIAYDGGGAVMFRQGGIAHCPDPESVLTVLFHSRTVGAAGNPSCSRNSELDRLLADGLWIALYHYASRALSRPRVLPSGRVSLLIGIGGRRSRPPSGCASGS